MGQTVAAAPVGRRDGHRTGGVSRHARRDEDAGIPTRPQDAGTRPHERASRHRPHRRGLQVSAEADERKQHAPSAGAGREQPAGRHRRRARPAARGFAAPAVGHRDRRGHASRRRDRHARHARRGSRGADGESPDRRAARGRRTAERRRRDHRDRRAARVRRDAGGAGHLGGRADPPADACGPACLHRFIPSGRSCSHELRAPGRAPGRTRRDDRAAPARQGQRARHADVARAALGDELARRDAGGARRRAVRVGQPLHDGDRSRAAGRGPRADRRSVRRPRAREAAAADPRTAGHGDGHRALPEAGDRRDPRRVHRRGRGHRHRVRPPVLLGRCQRSPCGKSTSA